MRIDRILNVPRRLSAFVLSPQLPLQPRSSSALFATKDLEFRAPKVSDVDAISELLVECFETDLQWFEFPEKDLRRKRYRDMLQSSFLRRINEQPGEKKSLSFLLLVAQASQIVGFVQIGSLPPPPGFLDTDNEDTTVSTSRSSEDVPYIANLCVLPKLRKSGVGKKMVDICQKWLARRDFENVFIAVEYDNMGAKKFYQRQGFQWIGLLNLYKYTI